MAKDTYLSMVPGHGARGSDVLCDQRPSYFSGASRRLRQAAKGRGLLLEALPPYLSSLLDMSLADAVEAPCYDRPLCILYAFAERYYLKLSFDSSVLISDNHGAGVVAL